MCTLKKTENNNKKERVETHVCDVERFAFFWFKDEGAVYGLFGDRFFFFSLNLFGDRWNDELMSGIDSLPYIAGSFSEWVCFYFSLKILFYVFNERNRRKM